MLSGILNLDKPRGMTSHDVVQAVRKSVGLRTVGHTGTLDPNASGVMLLCLGRATKFAQFFEGLEKTYWTVMRLGICTDTQDATGTVTRECDVPALQANQVQDVLSRFTGDIEQMPPMYSAVKYRGQRLYRLARQGQVVPRQSRGVRVRRLELLDHRGPLLTLGVTCSKGTYIRTLCEDIGLALGCGAHMVQLQRCRVGTFSLQQASSLERLRRQARGTAPDHWCLPLAQALAFLPPLFLTARQYSDLRLGRREALPSCLATLSSTPPVAPSYRLCTHRDQTVGVLHRQSSDPEKWKIYHLV